MNKLMKCSLKSLGQIQCAKVPRCSSWNKFFSTLIWGAIAPQSLHLALQTNPFPPFQSKVLWTKTRADNRPQSSKYYCSGSLRFI